MQARSRWTARHNLQAGQQSASLVRALQGSLQLSSSQPSVSARQRLLARASSQQYASKLRVPSPGLQGRRQASSQTTVRRLSARVGQPGQAGLTMRLQHRLAGVGLELASRLLQRAWQIVQREGKRGHHASLRSCNRRLQQPCLADRSSQVCHHSVPVMVRGPSDVLLAGQLTACSRQGNFLDTCTMHPCLICRSPSQTAPQEAWAEA